MSRGARLGDLRRLARLLADPPAGDAAGRIAALCDRIEAAPQPPAPAEVRLAAEIGVAAGRNLRRLAATLAGLRAAQGLLAAARGDGGHATYGPAGQVQRLDTRPARLEQRR